MAREIPRRVGRHLHRVMCAPAIGLGALLLIVGAVNLLQPAALYSDASPPSRLVSAARGCAFIVLAAAVLLPYRLRLPPRLARARLLLVVLTALLATCHSLRGLLDYLHGEKHWLIIPTLTLVLLAGWSALGALLAARPRLPSS